MKHYLIRGILLLLASLIEGDLFAQGWQGSFTLIPASAPEMVLESISAGESNPATVSLGHPSAAANQIWVITPQGDGFYSVKPANAEKLLLTVASGNANNGTDIVLAAAGEKVRQLWSLHQNDNGSVSLLSQSAPAKGLDDFGGGQRVGAKIDLWDFNETDEHLQWIIKPLAGASVPPNLPPLPPAPPGVIKNFTYDSSTLFPGTRRDGTVFIPAQYDGTQPACVYVQQDGYDAAMKGRLEALIAARQMPVTIGIFISSGSLAPPQTNAAARRNRCFEYDSVGDRYVRFLTEELLPFVATNFNLKLSASGNDRCLGGASSGGMAAFNAAWERPDAFSRVYASSGSFVAFRGGNEFPTLVRKYEAKPLRVYLTSATQDMENCAGDWYLLDQEMDQALTFSGYAHNFRSVNGPHCAGWNELFSDAMRFVWQDWPKPVSPGPSAPRVRDIIEAGESWELVAQGCPSASSPAVNSAGEVFFIDLAADTICRIGLDGQVTAVVTNAAQADGLSIGPANELYTVSQRSGKIMCYDQPGLPRVVAEGIYGSHLLARPDGSLYVTTPPKSADQAGGVWLVQAGRKTLVDSGLKFPTGLAYRPDQWLLAVADGHSKWVYSYQIQPDGRLANPERYFSLHVADWDDDAGTASVCYAQEGQLFVATRLGIQVCADDGPTQVILPLPDRSRVLGVCLGGPGMNTLFAFGGDKIWQRLVKPHALGAFSPSIHIKATPL